MAKLSAHNELGQIHKLDHKLAYCADGHILRNNGDGWKLWRKLKPEVDPVAHYEKRKAEYEQKLRDLPCWAQFRKLVHDTIPFNLRWKAVQAVKLMSTDPDGVYAELTDFHPSLITVDDAIQLCSAYLSALEEQRLKEPAQVA